MIRRLCNGHILKTRPFSEDVTRTLIIDLHEGRYKCWLAAATSEFPLVVESARNWGWNALDTDSAHNGCCAPSFTGQKYKIEQVLSRHLGLLTNVSKACQWQGQSPSLAATGNTCSHCFPGDLLLELAKGLMTAKAGVVEPCGNRRPNPSLSLFKISSQVISSPNPWLIVDSSICHLQHNEQTHEGSICKIPSRHKCSTRGSSK